MDLVYFFNGAGPLREQLMAIFSGPGTTPAELATWGNEAGWFVTDRRNQGRGWRRHVGHDRNRGSGVGFR